MNSKFNWNTLKEFYITQKNKINYALITLIAVAAVSYYYYQYQYLPKLKKADEAMYFGQQMYAIDSFDKALNGDGKEKGFLAVIKNYSGTPAANLAKYYSGICYLKTKQYKKAADMLEDFTSESDMVNGFANGALGDAYSEQKSYDKAITYYDRASQLLHNEPLWGAENLLKAAYLLELQNKPAEALKRYERIRTEFSESQQRRTAEKHIARLSQS